MCGPLALALPLKEQTANSRLAFALLYNTGRICTYALLGALFGFLGFGLAFWGVQRWVSVALGAGMILSVIFPFAFRRVHLESIVDRWLALFKRTLGSLFRFRTYTSVFAIGLLNGFLPCGLVYIALAGAIVARGPAEGAIFMILFGLGTVPALLAVSLAANFAGLRFRSSVRRLIPVVIVVIGMLFILRGLNLGVPYLSPKAVQGQTTAPDCCKH